MQIARRRVLIAMGALLMTGCAGLQTGFERPRIILTSFRAVPSEGFAPRFAIGLRVVNPNRGALNLRGLSYDVELEGHPLLSGVTSNLPRVPGYGEADIEVLVGVDLLGGLRLFNELLSDTRRERFRYALRARLDVGGLQPFVTLEEKGELSLAPARR
jgi:LEA14-like dessication related protein